MAASPLKWVPLPHRGFQGIVIQDSSIRELTRVVGSLEHSVESSKEGQLHENHCLGVDCPICDWDRGEYSEDDENVCE